MLSIGRLVAGQARYYLDHAQGRVDVVDSIGEGLEDYYGGRGEPRGAWVGTASRELGLEQEIAAVVGPDRIISELVGGAARDAGERLVDQLDRRKSRDGDSAEALVDAADLASAWARTLAAVAAVEGYSFHPVFDPLGL